MSELPLHLGRWAEQRAAWHLRLRGWRIVARNWIGGGGELDIVAARWKTLLVAEVRYRAGGRAWETVDRDKLNRCLGAARSLVRSHDLHAYRLRVDVLALDRTGRIERRRDVVRRELR